jgi:hypothetical protein
MAGNAGLLH